MNETLDWLLPWRARRRLVSLRAALTKAETERDQTKKELERHRTIAKQLTSFVLIANRVPLGTKKGSILDKLRSRT